MLRHHEHISIICRKPIQTQRHNHSHHPTLCWIWHIYMLMLPHQSHLPQLTTCIEHPPQTIETTTHHATINKTPTPQGHRQRKWTTNQCITKLTSLNQQQNYSQPAHIISHLRNIDNHNSTTNPSSIKHWHIWSKFGSTSITHIEHRRNINESTTTKNKSGQRQHETKHPNVSYRK